MAMLQQFADTEHWIVDTTFSTVIIWASAQVLSI